MTWHPEMKIFLVDDDIFCLNLYEQLLRNLGYNNLHSFNCGDDCLQQLQEQPGLAILDYNMEGLNGIEVMKLIKAFNPDILVYLISAQESPVLAEEAMLHGAMDYVVKTSLNPDKMEAIMQRVEHFYTPGAKTGKRSFIEKVKSGLGI